MAVTPLTTPLVLPLQAAYDRWLRARCAARRRTEELSAKRRKLKEDLESREGRAHTETSTATEAEAFQRMQREVGALADGGGAS